MCICWFSKMMDKPKPLKNPDLTCLTRQASLLVLAFPLGSIENRLPWIILKKPRVNLVKQTELPLQRKKCITCFISRRLGSHVVTGLVRSVLFVSLRTPDLPTESYLEPVFSVDIWNLSLRKMLLACYKEF